MGSGTRRRSSLPPSSLEGSSPERCSVGLSSVEPSSMQASGFRQFWHDLCLWWREQAREHGAADAGFLLLRNLWGFVRDSTPERRRARYGDMEYDWTHRVNTTSGTVGWRLRGLGLFLLLLLSPGSPPVRAGVQRPPVFT